MLFFFHIKLYSRRLQVWLITFSSSDNPTLDFMIKRLIPWTTCQLVVVLCILSCTCTVQPLSVCLSDWLTDWLPPSHLDVEPLIMWHLQSHLCGCAPSHCFHAYVFADKTSCVLHYRACATGRCCVVCVIMVIKQKSSSLND